MPGHCVGQLFGWETVMTFVLVSTVYAVAIGEPSFGVMGPFAVGLALFAMVFAGKPSDTCLASLALVSGSNPANQDIFWALFLSADKTSNLHLQYSWVPASALSKPACLC